MPGASALQIAGSERVKERENVPETRKFASFRKLKSSKSVTRVHAVLNGQSGLAVV